MSDRLESRVEIRSLSAGDEDMLSRVADDVFDDPIDAQRAAEFLADDRHHLVVAVDDGQVVGFASAVSYLARDLGCSEAWVLTDRGNTPALRTYASAGGIEGEQDQVMFTFVLDGPSKTV